MKAQYNFRTHSCYRKMTNYDKMCKMHKNRKNKSKFRKLYQKVIHRKIYKKFSKMELYTKLYTLSTEKNVKLERIKVDNLVFHFCGYLMKNNKRAKKRGNLLTNLE